MHELHVATWSVLPFALLLLCIALLPIVAEKWWHNNLHKAILSIGLAIPIAVYLCWLEWGEGQHGLAKLEHAVLEYVDFIALLAALYTVAGGIAIQGQFRPTPIVNVGFLALGALLANVIGTTGASMLFIRPLLRINHVRTNRGHLPIFFIILVSNLGGLLTPLGDPPLFLGFLNGVDFFWTISMWPHWLFVNGLVLAIAFVWDTLAYRKEPDQQSFPPRHGSFVIAGSINFVFLIGVLAAVLMRSPTLMGDYRLEPLWATLIMATMALLSWFCTARSVREHNQYSWEAIIEVAVLFVGIFVTMVPALALLTDHRDSLGIREPWHYFWLTGLLSACLDNAPTYMTFAALAAGGQNLTALSQEQPLLLQAISAGAVFMGALSYIGNGPNFMVKSMAENMGYRMPSFFGFLLYASVILMPIFALTTWIFFLP
jgi:Na+/H+ antiporter NhaD/arsenite permease-like protein